MTGNSTPALPCACPDAPVRPGRLVDLERLDITRHASGLWEAVGRHAGLWAMIPPGPFADEAAFLEWLTPRAERTDVALYAIVEKTGGRTVAGLFLLLGVNPAMGTVEMGLVYGSALTRKTAGTEAFFLLARYVLGTLRYRRLEWRCGPDHTGSRHAAERFGFTLEGVLRQTLWAKGRSWDTAVYAMLDREWPAVAVRLTEWLSPENFGADGGQRRPLKRPRSAG
jgi:RimJ/RimL family protein N-acetyltransferase